MFIKSELLIPLIGNYQQCTQKIIWQINYCRVIYKSIENNLDIKREIVKLWAIHMNIIQRFSMVLQ